MPSTSEPVARERLVHIYEFIRSYIEENGYPPAVREIAEYLTDGEENPPWPGWSISTSVADYSLRRMESLNMIQRDLLRSRAIKLLPRDEWREDPRWRGV